MDLTGRTLGNYAIVQKIGTGGMAEVYQARDVRLDRMVALKVLSETLEDSEEFLQRFQREVRAAARLEHPNIIPVYDVGQADGRHYFAMRLINGGDLRTRIRRGMTEFEALAVVREIAGALAHAHAVGLVHRDVKPENIMFGEDEHAMLTDFGIARVVESGTNVTRTGVVVGSVRYISPEQVSGEPADGRADIYSLGVVLFEALTGAAPFDSDNVVRTLYMHMNEPVPRLRPELARLQPLLDTMLAKRPGDRPASANDVIALIDTYLPAEQRDVRSAASADDNRTSIRLPQLGTAPVAAPPAPQPGYAPPQPGYAPPQPMAPVAPPENPTGAVPWPWATPPVDAEHPKVGPYLVLGRIAEGRSGTLYQAFDFMRNKPVALKVVKSNDATSGDRLGRAAKLWLHVSHPNLVRVLEVHPPVGDQPAYIVSEMIEGSTLAEQLDLTMEQAVRIIVQVCDALEHIHAKNYVHREVKPSNILISDDLRVTLLDSGIARKENPEVDSFTRTGMFVGDLTYAAPEQFGGKVGKRADIYSVAAILYELVTDTKLPFPMHADWVPDPSVLDRLPTRLGAAIVRGLAPEPADRFATIGELRDQLTPLVHAAPDPTGSVVVALHGIRTHAAWQRAFSEVAGRVGLSAHVDRWNFGFFSTLKFLLPWARLAKVRWFREVYQQEFGETTAARHSLPSIVAHSFGSYILGNALLRYPYLRFDKVLLCGSILPRGFPWDRLIERGQVQAVRNEYGAEDFWTRSVGYFVPRTGPSGLRGFTARHARFEQERFVYAHSEYFERGHMTRKWLPFLRAQVSERPLQDTYVPASPADSRPWGLYAIYAVLALALALVAVAVA